MIFPRWITNSSGESIDLEIPHGGVLLAIIASDQSKSSFAAILHETALSMVIGTSMREWLQPVVGALGKKALFRLVGSPAALIALAGQLKESGIVEGTHVPIEASRPIKIQFLPQQGRIRLEKSVSTLPPPVIFEREKRKTRVMVVDDSASIRKVLAKIFDTDPAIECVAAVENPLHVLDAIEKHKPDVITLDIHMPEMDGVTLLKEILSRKKIPAIMISAMSKEDGNYVLDALEAGAVDYIQKPSMSEMSAVAPIICEKIKSAHNAYGKIGQIQPLKLKSAKLTSASVDQSYLIAIGSSTGGTEALKKVLTLMPDKIPGIVIVQHIPAVFSKALADRLNQLCSFEVKEAVDGDVVAPNKVLIAPGGKQMKLKSEGGVLKAVIDDSAPVNRHKPSVDVLFDSIASLKIKKVAAAILTGMGSDGAKGLLQLKQAGARTLAQDEATSVVFGMPKEAARLGGAEQVVPLDQIAEVLTKFCAPEKRPKAA